MEHHRTPHVPTAITHPDWCDRDLCEVEGSDVLDVHHAERHTTLRTPDAEITFALHQGGDHYPGRGYEAGEPVLQIEVISTMLKDALPVPVELTAALARELGARLFLYADRMELSGPGEFLGV